MLFFVVEKTKIKSAPQYMYLEKKNGRAQRNKTKIAACPKMKARETNI